jgi:hypothetical protein
MNYVVRQKDWVKRHGIRSGSKVKVVGRLPTRPYSNRYPPEYKGWKNSWVTSMDFAVGMTGVVSDVINSGVLIQFNGYPYRTCYFPYFVLCVIPD